MISGRPAAFKFIDRGHSESLALIPGWATDYRIFAPLDLKFNYILPLDFSPFTFEKGLAGALRDNNIKSVSLLGWSLGGFVAQEFAAKNGELVDSLILVSVRKRYAEGDIAEARKAVLENRKGYLYKFYRMCFYKKEEGAYFRKNLLREFCNTFKLDHLLAGLDYLGGAEIRPELLSGLNKVKIIHGLNDNVAPPEEVLDIKKGLPSAELVMLEEAGHMPFFKEGFEELI